MKKLTFIGLGFLILGIISGIIQNTFYGYIDDAGILHDSIFLTLSVIFVLIGLILLLISLVQFVIRKLKK